MLTDTAFAARWRARTDRWSLVRQFVAEWRKPIEAGDGWGDAEIEQVAARVPAPLPSRCASGTPSPGGGGATWWPAKANSGSRRT